VEIGSILQSISPCTNSKDYDFGKLVAHTLMGQCNLIENIEGCEHYFILTFIFISYL